MAAASTAGLLLATGCGPSSGGNADSIASAEVSSTAHLPFPKEPSASAGTVTTSQPAAEWTAEQQGVIDSYDGAMSAFDRATADPPDPDNPALLATTIDPVLTEVRSLASSWKGFGQALRYPANSVHRIDPVSVDVVGDTATVETCNLDDGVLYEPATGRVLNDKVTTAHDRATLTRTNGSWKLATRAQLEKWDGVAGCAVATS